MSKAYLKIGLSQFHTSKERLVKTDAKKLLSTIPLPLFVSACKQASANVVRESEKLKCTSGYVVNVVLPHKALRPENWIYVYDEDKLSTRITYVSKLDGKQREHCSIQVEVYESPYKMLNLSADEVKNKVVEELHQMGLIRQEIFCSHQEVKSSITYFKWMNVIFDHQRYSALDSILKWLNDCGLSREDDDLAPNSRDWERTPDLSESTLTLAGRFSQWKYLWSDDCILRGRQLGRAWGKL